jgi:N-carbamoyl-L-amino-acid hydrolase
VISNQLRTIPDEKFARTLFQELERHWNTPDDNDPTRTGGMQVPGYTLKENEAMNVILKHAHEMNMQCFSDLSGNLYMIYPGRDHSKTVVAASHVDTVRNGGRYDGRAGIVGPMAALKTIHRQGLIPPQDICVMICRTEESAHYGRVSIGAHLAVNLKSDLRNKILHDKALLDKDAKPPSDLSSYHLIEKVDQGGRTIPKSLVQNMIDSGINLDTLCKALETDEAMFPIKETAAYIESHIEQAPVLKALGEGSIGIVDDIRGNVRWVGNAKNPYFQLEGKTSHSGGTPMEVREDSAVTLVRFCHELIEKFDKLLKEGTDLVYTIPYLQAGDKETPTNIAKDGEMMLEIRSKDLEVLNMVKEIVSTQLKEFETKPNTAKIHTDKDRMTVSSPAHMNEEGITQLKDLAEQEEIYCKVLSSGAGHDAAVFANAGIPTNMLFIRDNGNSHNPCECMDMKSFMNAHKIMGDFFMQDHVKRQVQRSPAPSPFIEHLLSHGAMERLDLLPERT